MYCICDVYYLDVDIGVVCWSFSFKVELGENVNMESDKFFLSFYDFK